MGEPQAVAIPFPHRGVERGLPASKQPEFTTHDLRNVRSLHAGDRQGGGKRDGLSKAFQDAAGGRINLLAGFSNNPQAGFGDEGVVTDFSTTGAGLADGSDIGANYWQYQQLGSALSSIARANSDFVTIASNVITWDPAVALSGQSHGLIASAPSTNYAQLTFEAKSQADGTLTQNDGPTGSPVNLGPAIRISQGNGLGSELLVFQLRYAGSANMVTPTIIKRVAGTQTTEWEGADITLNGSATPSPLSLTFEEVDADTVRVTIDWPGGGSGGSDIDFTADVALSDLGGDDEHVLAGFVGLSLTNGNARTISEFLVETRSFSEGTAIKTLAGTEPNPLPSAQRYHLPAGFTSFSHSEITDAVTEVDGPVDNSAQQPYPLIDDNDDQIERGSPGTSGFSGVTPTTYPAGRRLASQIVFPTAASNSSFAVFSRVAESFDAYIRFTGNVASVDSRGQQQYAATSNLDLIAWSQGAATDLETRSPTVTFSANKCFRPGDVFTIYDTGEASGARVRVVLRGVVIYESDAITLAPASFPDLYDAEGVSLTRNAIGMSSVGTGTAHDTYKYAEIGLQPEGGFGDPNEFGTTTFYLAAFSDGDVDVGNFEGGDLVTLSGQGFIASASAQAGAFARKLYCVNGDQSLIVDPIEGIVQTWATEVSANGAGTLPGQCKLVGVYRGRIVLANQDSNPAIWYMSRTLDPLDWDFNAEPLATAPYAGSNATFGQPGDAILALIPYLDDYLIFGCAKSLWIMEGDPGYGGRVQNLARQVGVLGPRAWCFDENEHLYFLGNGGLYRIAGIPGRPEPVRHGALIGLLDRVDAQSTRIQLVYDEFRKYVHIMLTPADNSAGTHVVYDPQRDAFWLDEYPTAQQPWAVLSGTGPNDAQRRALVAGNDGFIRRFDDTAMSDDGTAINAYFDSAPLQPFGPRYESMVMELNAEGFTGAETVTWAWYVAESAEQVRVATTPVVTGSWFAGGGGFQEPVGLRERGGAHRLRVSQNSDSLSFEIDQLEALLVPVSRRRGA